ncbi:hypothetical protein IV203_001163 [Nitzschia inconspicua]|uniref:Uncharacterized protein n=1 Tax=Nitzschia inconspicua TaxID=303405 RepID=A0A9K3L6K9_9STRA|nr:hypothetical protein IV203_001163 [Nitzschia inconspicua]
MTLPFYDELLEKQPRVCGAVVFSRFMKNPVVCSSRAEDMSIIKQQQYMQFHGGDGTSFTQNITSSSNLAPPSHRSLPSTISSDDSSLRRTGSPMGSLHPPHLDNVESHNEIDQKHRSCIPWHPSSIDNNNKQTNHGERRLSEEKNPLLAHYRKLESSNNLSLPLASSMKDPSVKDQFVLRSNSREGYATLKHDIVPTNTTIQLDQQASIIMPSKEEIAVTNGQAETNHNNDPSRNVKSCQSTAFNNHHRDLHQGDSPFLSPNLLGTTSAVEPVIAELTERRDTYKSEAEKLRKELEFFRSELSNLRKSLPQKDGELWEEADDVWKTIGNMEFSHSFSRRQTSDDLFQQRVENYFKKDWEFSLNGRELHDDARSDCSPLDCAGNYGAFTRPSLNVETTTLRRLEENNHQTRRNKVSFMTPEVSQKCEYDDTCVTITVEPAYGTQPTSKDFYWTNQQMQSLNTPATKERTQLQVDDTYRIPNHVHSHAREDDQSYDVEVGEPNLPNPLKHDKSLEEDDNDDDKRCAESITQTDEPDYQLHIKDQEMEIIPDVDEAECGTSNVEYKKDIAIVKKLLQKYKKRPELRATDENSSGIHVDSYTPLVQIENIDAVIECKETRDPDMWWFERHANLSQDKEDRDGSRRSARISLTLGLSPISSSQTSHGSRRSRCTTALEEKAKNSERSGRSCLTSPQCNNEATKQPVRGVPPVGKISKDTLRKWEERKW